MKTTNNKVFILVRLYLVPLPCQNLRQPSPLALAQSPRQIRRNPRPNLTLFQHHYCYSLRSFWPLPLSNCVPALFQTRLFPKAIAEDPSGDA